jgi:hypothetical protein
MKGLKKIMSLLLGAAVALPLGVVGTSAAGEAEQFTIAVETPTDALRRGTEFQVPITLSNNPGVATVAFSVVLDSTRLEWVGEANYDNKNTETYPFIEGDLGFDSLTEPRTLSGKFNFNAEGNNTANGTILTLKLKVKANAPAGNASVELNMTADDVFDENLDNVTYTKDDDQTATILVPINNVDVTLAAPALGAAPQTTVSSDGFSGSVTWSPAAADGKFAPETEYTATVTLAPTNSTYAPFGNPAAVTVNGGAVTSLTTNAADSIVFTKAFAATSGKINVNDKIVFNSASFIYNGANQSLPEATITDVTGGTWTYSGHNLIQKNAGSYTAKAIYESPTVYGEKEVTWTISQKTLTVTGATATDRTYNGTTAVAITGATLVGVETDDSVSIGTISGTIATADAGVSKPVTVTVTLDGTAKDNYTVTAPTGLTVNITPATPTYPVPETKDIKIGSALGIFTAVAPSSATGVSSEAVAGTPAWFTDDARSIPVIDSDVAGLVENNTITLYWQFTPASPNYMTVVGNTVFTITTGDPQPMAFANAAVAKTYGDANFTNLATHIANENDAVNGARGAITYSSDDLSVATVNSTTGEVTIVSVGSATITATAAAVPGSWAEDTATYVLTVTRKTPTIADLTFDLTGKEYNGIPQGIPAPTAAQGVVGLGAITVKYDGGDTLPTNAGTYEVTVDIAQGSNYTEATLTLGEFTITPKPISIINATVEPKTYDGTTAGTVSGVTFSDTPANYEATAVFTAADAGTGKAVTVTVGLVDTNFTLPMNTITTTADINKADTTGVAQTLSVVKEYAAEYEFDLNKLLPNLASPCGFGTVSYAVSAVENADGVLATEPSGGVTTPLTLDVASAAVGKTASVTVTVTSTNYADFTAIITVEVTDKFPVTIGGITTTGRAYNGEAYTYAGTPILTDTAGETVSGVTLNALYEAIDGSYSSATPPTNAGEYRLTLSVPASNPLYTGSAVYEFEITPAEVTVTADSVSIQRGDAIPSFTFTQSPAALFGEDVWLANPSLECPTVDANTAGQYPIVISGGDLGANYTIKRVNGTLTVVSNNIATLSALWVSNYTLTPWFSANNQNYTLTVSNDVNYITIGATATDPASTISGLGTMSLYVGANVFYVTVTAQDGVTSMTYKITVTREAANNYYYPTFPTVPPIQGEEKPVTTDDPAKSEPETTFGAKDGEGNSYGADGKIPAAELKSAYKSGVTKLFGDTRIDGKISARLYLNLQALQRAAVRDGVWKAIKYDITVNNADENTAVQKIFDKYYGITPIHVHFAQQGEFQTALEVAIKADLSDLDTDNLYIYTYNAKTGKFSRLNVDYTIDKSGFLHIKTNKAYDILITDEPLKKK